MELLSSNFSTCKSLPQDHPFLWENSLQNPKYIPPPVSYRGDWFKTMEYNILHTGGFLRLSTDRGRVYFLAQNELGHTTPDWKFHISCELEDIPKAWNIVACLFMQQHCEIGMKAALATRYSTGHRMDQLDVLDDEDIPKIQTWPDQQRGREITVYVFQYFSQYGNGPMDNLAPDDEAHIYQLCQSFEAGYDTAFWFRFIRLAERRLKNAGIRSRGTADGDLALPGCDYVSLRNEAFIKVPPTGNNEPFSNGAGIDARSTNETNNNCCCFPDDEVVHLESSSDVPMSKWELQYPPNNYGWNAAAHFNPMTQVISCLQTLVDELADNEA